MKNLIAITAILTLTACATPSHTVIVPNSMAGTYSCSQLDAGIVEAQGIIDRVNSDLNGISATEVFDTLMWGGLQMPYKIDNQHKAINAAQEQIRRFQSIKRKKRCK